DPRAVFAGDFDFRRHLGDRLDPAARYATGVIARSAGQDQDAVDALTHTVGLFAEQQRIQRDRLVQRVGDRLGLFETLLLHAVPLRDQLDRVGEWAQRLLRPLHL